VFRTPCLAVALAASLGASVVVGRTVRETSETGVFPEGEEIAAYLATYVAPGDRVLVGSPAGPIVTYYFVQRGLSTEPLYRPVQTARRAIIVSNESVAFRQSRH
jgi:hypothetical protein